MNANLLLAGSSSHMPKTLASELVRLAIDNLPSSYDSTSSLMAENTILSLDQDARGGHGQNIYQHGQERNAERQTGLWGFLSPKRAEVGTATETCHPDRLAWFPRLCLFHVHAGHPSATAPLLAALSTLASGPLRPLTAMDDSTFASLARPLSSPLCRTWGGERGEGKGEALIAAVVAEAATRLDRAHDMDLGYAIRWACFVADYSLSRISAGQDLHRVVTYLPATDTRQAAESHSGGIAVLDTARAGWFDRESADNSRGGKGRPEYSLGSVSSEGLAALACRMVKHACIRSGAHVDPSDLQSGGSKGGDLQSGGSKGGNKGGDEMSASDAMGRNGEEAAVPWPVGHDAIMGLARRVLLLEIRDHGINEALAAAFRAAMRKMNSPEAADSAHVMISLMAGSQMPYPDSRPPGVRAGDAPTPSAEDGFDVSPLFVEVFFELCSKAFSDIPSLQPMKQQHLLIALASMADHIDPSSLGSDQSFDVSLLAPGLLAWYSHDCSHEYRSSSPSDEDAAGSDSGRRDDGTRRSPSVIFRDAFNALSACARLRLNHPGLVSALEDCIQATGEVVKMDPNQVSIVAD